jgi:tetratricopeptide (TPR) repeat protein
MRTLVIGKMAEPSETLQTAIELYNRGDSNASEQLCRTFLETEPESALALHLLGLIAIRQGRTAQALELIGRSLEIDSSDAIALMNYGNVLAELGEFERALLSYESACVADPSSWLVWNAAGAALHRSGNYAEAKQSYQRGLAVAPSEPALLTNLALSHRAEGQYSEAITFFDRASECSPTYLDAVVGRASLLNALELYAEALHGLDASGQALSTNRNYKINRAIALRGLQRFEDALIECDAALALDQNSPEVWNIRGTILFEAGALDEALICHDEALRLLPDSTDAITSRGAVLLGRGDLAGALAEFDKALALKPDHAQAHWNKSHCLLLMGDFDRGWREYEWRKKLEIPIEARNYAKPLWTGVQDLRGKTIYLYSTEQGLGDTIQFCRYANILRGMGAEVILEVQERIAGLLRGSLSEDVSVIGAGASPGAFDFHSPLLSLPGALKTDAHNIPGDVPYLKAEPGRVQAWADRIGKHGFKVGIAWQGRKGGVNDLGRSPPLAHYQEFSKIPGVRLISLQKNQGTEQLRDLPPGVTVETLGDDLDPAFDAFMDTAAVMESLDLIITSDTSIAHLAGALARPTWVSLRFTPDWRWLLDRTDSPWYPTMRLFRQPTRGDWATVFEDMAFALRDVVQTRAAT